MNQTPLAADLSVTELEGTAVRYGVLTTKSTFRFDAEGRVELDTQDPIPLFDADEPHELGWLPGDLIPRFDDAFEVILLGAAHGRGGREVQRVVVELGVGNVRRRLAVFGDRRWERRMLGLSRAISEPAPFRRMPLGYERAYGGSADAYFDMRTAITLEHPLNKHGRGFDADKQAKHVAAGLRAPEGFPYSKYERPLPNLEHPERLITEWEHEPEPYCWATIPADVGFRAVRVLRHLERTGQPMPPEVMEREILYRAHPDWVIARPAPESRVVMVGLTPGGRVELALPALRVLADYALGERIGTRELVPHLLVLLPEERRLYLVHRLSFNMETAPAKERSFRLRLEQGWYVDPEPSHASPAAP